MLPWWVAPIIFMAGGLFGIFITLLMMGKGRDDRP